MTTTRTRCPRCGQYPTTRADGSLARHHYPWPHPQHGHICPGSRTIPNQPRLEEPNR